MDYYTHGKYGKYFHPTADKLPLTVTGTAALLAMLQIRTITDLNIEEDSDEEKSL